MQSVIPVILSGGAGTRLWPLSRQHHPKQFLDVLGGQLSMLQQTAKRVEHLEPAIVVCNEAHRFLVAEQLTSIDLPAKDILLEPVGRNTAPAITLAALRAMEVDSEAILAVFPADHLIDDLSVFNEALERAIEAACDDKLVTFGVVPSHAETGYGYIKAASTAATANAVEHFVEKPDEQTAQKFVDSGQYFWNSGMFVFKAKVYLQEIERCNSAILDACRESLDKAVVDLDFIRLDKASFEQCPSDSIDYAVMEHSKNAVVVAFDCLWSDVGNWQALWTVADKDDQQNAVIGDAIAIDSSNNLIHGNERLVAALGVENLVIVDSADALLVANKDKVQNVRAVVELMKKQGRSEHITHREVHRPWGCFDELCSGNRYQVKHIKVKPGASLSLQMHHHRAEHWVVVKGTASVQVGEEQRLVTENESIYIPIGAKHRLSNPGKVALELIEVQTGSYLGEDDIVRIEDMYRRS